MHLFSRHVSRDIAQSVWEQRDSFLEGNRTRSQKLMTTVLFTDLKGFSSIAERMDPAALTDWLNEYLDKMASVVAGHDGVVKQFTGDGLMAVFGIPLARRTEEEMRQDA